ncbi:MAG: hypothetical protein LBK82_14015 [Planctomycetaceae bacterium]|nr:hypothetical protein [Planctomycetaceae bacterium]
MTDNSVKDLVIDGVNSPVTSKKNKSATVTQSEPVTVTQTEQELVVGQTAAEAPDVVTQLEKQSFEALVSKGIYALLFPMINDGEGIKADISNNVLNGYPVGGITSGGDSADSEEFQDQLMGGEFKTFIGGAIDPGDVTFNTYFSVEKGRPQISGVRNSRVITPQFILILAIQSETDGKLQGFFAAGVNYSGGNDIKGDYGKIIGSSLKFKITGSVKAGATAVGLIDKELYGELPYLSIDDVVTNEG